MTESVQVTNEEVKTSTSKPNSKALKLSNENTEHGKPSEKSKHPLTKVVVRHLPPTMTLESFLEQVSPLPPVDYMYFVKADSSLGLLSFSRAYLNFVNIQDLIIFTEKFDNYVFIDAKGNEYPAIVEFAPFQRIPKQRTNRKKDPRAGTIENDLYYLDFVEALKAEEVQRKSASKTNKQHFFETTSTNTTAQKVTSTPLLEYLKARKLDKIRVKEDKINEKKKRELERKKAREERSAGRQGEGDAHPVKVVTPPHGRSESSAMHSPSVRHSEDKRGVREVKRREDDRGRTRDRDRDVDVRPKDTKRPGKSYQEERQRLNERRQAAKVGPSRADGDPDECAKAEGVSPKSSATHENEPKEVVRRPDKVIRPSTKPQDTKRTPERPRRPERKPVSPREANKEEPRKKSYALEREQRRNTVRKDVASSASAEEARGAHAPTEKSTSGGPEKEKTELATSLKGKDPRAERRIRNKDRPSIEIYRPGMGRFSRQRLEREKGSIVGSSTERDSASPSPSPSPSVSRAASVTGKASAHSTQSKSIDELAVQSEAQPSEEAATSSQPADSSSKTDDTAGKTGDSASIIEDTAAETENAASKTEDAAAKTENAASETEDAAAKTENAVAKTENAVAKTEDATAKTEDVTARTEDTAAKTEDTAVKTEDTAVKTEDTAVKTEDSAAKTEDAIAKAEDTAAKTDDIAAKTEDTAAKTEDTAVETEVTAAQTGDPAAKTKDAVAETDDTVAQTEDTSSKTEDTTSKTEDTTSKTKDSMSESVDSAPKTEDQACEVEDTRRAAKTEDSDSKKDDSSLTSVVKKEDTTVQSTEDLPAKEDSIKQEETTVVSDDAPSQPCGNAANEDRNSKKAQRTPKNCTMSWFPKTLANRPYLVLAIISVLSIICFIVSVTLRKLPSFQDPTLGFETRGTSIANRLTSWKNLREEIGASGSLTVNPTELRRAAKFSTTAVPPTLVTTEGLIDDAEGHRGPSGRKGGKGNKGRKKQRPSTDGSQGTQGGNPSRKKWRENSNNNKSESDSSWKILDDLLKDKKQKENEHLLLSFDGFFCSAPAADYSHAVVASRTGEDLLSVLSLHALCEIDKTFRINPHFSSICQRTSGEKCCPTWGLHNYVALLHNRSDCSHISEDDVESTRKTLILCAQYYHNLELPADCMDAPLEICSKLPSQCTRHNAVYNIMHFLIDTDFLPPNNYTYFKLSYTMLFLPVAASSGTLDYFLSLDLESMQSGSLIVPAVDFGLKNALFDLYLVRDTWLICTGAVAILLCMWIYVGSFFITAMTMVAVAFSLCIAYFLYTIVFNLRFFPFMNVLACVVAIGIGADDTFIFCKVWNSFKVERNLSVEELVENCLRHACVSMFVTSLTTAVAFFASYISSITAINCFSIFAGTAVCVNFLLMVTWLPATVVISEQWECRQIQWLMWGPWVRQFQAAARKFRENMANGVEMLVVRFSYVWLLILSCVTALSVVGVVYYPRLRLPDSPEFQLFTAAHPFEQYDWVFRNKFWFERVQEHTFNVKLPLRFVWGIEPIDNGNYLDPALRGKLSLDPTFNLSSTDAQVWLFKFCKNTQHLPFLQSTLGPIPENCFIDSLVWWMERKCYDSFDKIDRSPCCETTHFPFPPPVFENCTVQAVDSLYRTPRTHFTLLNPDLVGPKFSRNLTHPKLQALVVEYDSNVAFSFSYAKMHEFYTEVEEWIEKEMESAPPGMRNGWFVSDLSFYDLQHTLANSVVTTIIVSLALALAVLLTVTRNLLVSLFAIVTIASAIFVTVGALILMGWKLNVLESVAVSTAIGLSVDFPLHYGVAYRFASNSNDRKGSVKIALSQMGGPTAMAALTTATAGAFMLPSSVIAYIQVGMFLTIVMFVSWVYATFFLMSLLSVVGPQNSCGQLQLSRVCCGDGPPRSPGTTWVNRGRADSAYGADRSDLRSESTLSACTLHVSCSETHELDALAQAQSQGLEKTVSE